MHSSTDGSDWLGSLSQYTVSLSSLKKRTKSGGAHCPATHYIVQSYVCNLNIFDQQITIKTNAKVHQHFHCSSFPAEWRI